MHLADGILPLPVLAGGFLTAGVASALAARRLEAVELPRIAVLSSAFFIGSLIHVPLGVTSVHLLLHGLVGVLLGPASFLAIGLGLLFGAILLGHGGLTTLGVNACLLGLPAMGAGWLFALAARGRSARARVAWAAALTALATLVSVVAAAALLLTAGEQFKEASAFLLTAHLPTLFIEPAVAAAVVSFLQKVKPELVP